MDASLYFADSWFVLPSRTPASSLSPRWGLLSLHAWGCYFFPKSVLGLDPESCASSFISCRDGLVARRRRSRGQVTSRSRNPRARVTRWTSRRRVHVHRAAFSCQASFPTTALCFDRSSYACDTALPESNVSRQEPLNLLPLADPHLVATQNARDMSVRRTNHWVTSRKEFGRPNE